MESYQITENQLLEELHSIYPRSRFLLACKSCYHLKPPVIVEIGNLSECPWCVGQGSVLLFETKESREKKESRNEFVEYTVIRERKSLSEVSNWECKANLGRKPCKHGDQCTFAHSNTERRLWQLESKHGIKWKKIVDYFNHKMPTNRDTLKGVLHCFICRHNVKTGKEFSAHCDSPSHKQLIDSLDVNSLQWKHRPLPESDSESFSLCSSVGAYRCRNGDKCHYAHSEQELEEWNKRCRLQREIRVATESGLISFPDQILKEYQESSSLAKIMKSSLPNVTVTSDKNLIQRVPLSQQKITWNLKLQCSDSAMKLNHAAFVPIPGAHDKFTICRLRGRKRSKRCNHMDFTVRLEDDYSYNLHGGQVTFQVKSAWTTYGTYYGCLVFEFRKQPRPLLLLRFEVEVVDTLGDVVKLPIFRPSKTEVVWEKDREIIPWEEGNQNEFDTTLKNLFNKYKAPLAALDSTVKGQEIKDVLNPQSLDAKNYVKDMHKFLYKEELARTRMLAGPKPFVIALSENYMSGGGGMRFNVNGELYAVFELPTHLSRDTDEGFLILEGCKKVLIGKAISRNSPVYEAKIEKTFVDHVILLLSKRCVKDWNLKTGDVLSSEIQFQLDRTRFCRCHYALDHLEERRLLSLVCPKTELITRNMESSMYWNQGFYNPGLDDDQAAVLKFLTTPFDLKGGSVLPLFVVQGSFGTGKTYTISKCVMYLLETNPNARILICTHSNSAADHYIQLNFRDVYEWKDKVARVLYHGREPKYVNDLVKEYCLWNENGRSFRYPTAQEITSRRVFITTFETSLGLGIKGSGIKGAFTHIFLDEAAQAMEAEAILPLTVALSEKTKIVIAGDHKQIAQKIYSKPKLSDFNDSNFTFLERIFWIYHRLSSQCSNLVVLRNNYRCVPPILHLIASTFYVEGLFIPCSNLDPPLGLQPIQFHHVEGQCIQDPFSSEYYNTAEAYQIGDIVTNLLLSFPMHLVPNDIAVVSLYFHQRKIIRSCLRQKEKNLPKYQKLNLNDVEVLGVRGIQGLEYKVVILSCVHHRQTKADKEGANFGLLSDLNLLNTAFTRSMLSIIAVGHGPTLLSLGQCTIVWRKFLETCSKANSLFPPTTSLKSIKDAVTIISRFNPEAVEFIFNPTKGQSETSNQIEVKTENAPLKSFSDNEDSDDEVNLPLKDELLNEIIKKATGSSPEKMGVRTDRSGREFVEADPDRSVDSRKNIHCEFSLGHLKELLRNRAYEFKRCIIKMITWCSAEATVLDDDSDIRKILIKTKVALGRSFDGDEVVVHITHQNEPFTSDDDNPPVYGKVIGVLERYDDLSKKKFICVPDKFSSGLMVPVSHKITKFIILGSRRRKEPGVVPICQLTGNGTEVRRVREVTVDRNSITLDKVSHFVVRFVKWPANCIYPIGYVSEEIKPKNVEKYYSEVYDVPSVNHKKPAEAEAKQLSERKISTEGRVDLSDLFIFTIDPSGSTDLDDALSLERCPEHGDCWKIGIHIADVASVVPENKAVDSEARKRATSFYSGVFNVKTRKISHLLPKELSSFKCSLLADGMSRPAVSMFIHSSCLPDIITPGKGASESNIPNPILTTIRSHKQMTYKDAENCLRRAKRNGYNVIDVSTEQNLPDQLYIMWHVMLKLRLKRLGGAAFFSHPDCNQINELYEETTAHMLIEEAMITYNACTSIFLDAKACKFIQRIQEFPAPEESQKWMTDCSQFIGLSLYQQSCLTTLITPDQVDPHELIQKAPRSPLPVFPDIWKQIERAVQRNDLDSALVLFCSDAVQPAVCPGFSAFLGIQTRAKLLVNTDVKKLCKDGQVSHFSLRLPFYSHCSSPIRRYTDIIAQRSVILKCQHQEQRQIPSNVIQLEHVGQTRSSNDLKILSKCIEKRMQEAKDYGKDTKNASFAKDLSEKQRYDVANVVEVNDSHVCLNFLCLKNLPLSCCKLTFHELNLQSQSQTALTWKIKLYDVEKDSASMEKEGASEQGVSHQQLVSTVVSSQNWFRLLSCIQSSYLEPNAVPNLETLKQNFESMHVYETTAKRCPMRQGNKPCNVDNCKQCDDVLCHASKLGIKHYRKITMSLSLGMPMCVQLYCTLRKGICTASIQMISLSQDLDICLAHLRSPIEIFASDVIPHRGNNFKDVTAYIKHWRPLFRMEAIYKAVKESSNAFTLQNVKVQFDMQGTDSPGGSFTLSSGFSSERLLSIDVDDFLCLRIKNSSVSDDLGQEKSSPEDYFTWNAHAIVVSAEDHTYGFEVCSSQITGKKFSNTIDGEYVTTVEVLKLDISDRFIANALLKLDQEQRSNSQEIKSLCLNEDMPTIQHVRNYDIEVGSEVIPGMKFRLNDGQIEQIRLALGRNISMIQGPPGTGKSFVGAHLAYYFQKLNLEKTDSPGKILYCGPSNKSVDVVAKYLLDSPLKVLRVYGTSFEEQEFPNPLKPDFQRQQQKGPDKTISKITLHQRIRKNGNSHAHKINELHQTFYRQDKPRKDLQPWKDLHKTYLEYKSEVADAKQEEIEKHDVIICTCATAAMLALQLREKDATKGKRRKKKVKFTQCIIDECGMCQEPETLAPIVSSKSTQVVLIGDHMQLQPIIICKRAKDFGLGESMFERLKEHAGMLTNQYRMHPGICDFPSEKFYDGLLTTDETVIEREKARKFRFCYPRDSPESTAFFCHLVGKETTNYSLERGGEKSTYNETEAEAVIKILVYLHTTNRVPLSKIMILTPYTAQENTIKRMISDGRPHLKDVHVGTVISSQGSESDYVILSTVRSQPKSAIEEDAPLHWRRNFIGFVADPHQINVAITRAKSGLCIVGNKNVLEKDTETWSALLESYQSRQCIVAFGDPDAPWNYQWHT